VLAELRLENYAVIDNVAIEFAPGLNLLTGETGAGKSILIDALGLLLGEKASSDVIRTGAERALQGIKTGSYQTDPVAIGKGSYVGRYAVDEDAITLTSILNQESAGAGGNGRAHARDAHVVE